MAEIWVRSRMERSWGDPEESATRFERRFRDTLSKSSLNSSIFQVTFS